MIIRAISRLACFASQIFDQALPVPIQLEVYHQFSHRYAHEYRRGLALCESL